MEPLSKDQRGTGRAGLWAPGSTVAELGLAPWLGAAGDSTAFHWASSPPHTHPHPLQPEGLRGRQAFPAPPPPIPGILGKPRKTPSENQGGSRSVAAGKLARAHCAAGRADGAWGRPAGSQHRQPSRRSGRQAPERQGVSEELHREVHRGQGSPAQLGPLWHAGATRTPLGAPAFGPQALPVPVPLQLREEEVVEQGLRLSRPRPRPQPPRRAPTGWLVSPGLLPS